MEYKYRCKSKEDSVAVQKALLDMGYRWKGKGPDQIHEAGFLYIDEEKMSIMRSSRHFFENEANYPELIL